MPITKIDETLGSSYKDVIQRTITVVVLPIAQQKYFYKFELLEGI